MDTDIQANSCIDVAIRENRFGERLIYGLTTFVVLLGGFAIIYGAFTGSGLVALAGGICSTVIFPAFKMAFAIRRQNLAIRLMQEPLNRIQTPEDAAKATAHITDAFRDVFTKGDA